MLQMLRQAEQEDGVDAHVGFINAHLNLTRVFVTLDHQFLCMWDEPVICKHKVVTLCIKDSQFKFLTYHQKSYYLKFVFGRSRNYHIL